MNILVTGQLGPVSYSFNNKLTEYSKVIASSADINFNYIGNIHKAYNHAIGDDEFARLFNVHSIDTVLFFVDLPNLESPDFSAIEKLDIVLSLCVKYRVQKTILITSSYPYNGVLVSNEESSVLVNDNEKVLLMSCQSLCDSYRQNKDLDILTLYTPHMFGRAENKSFIGKMMLQAVTKNYITMEGQKEQVIDLLAQEDLGELVSRVLFDWPEDIHIMHLPGAATLSLKELGDLFGDFAPCYKNHLFRFSYGCRPSQQFYDCSK